MTSLRIVRLAVTPILMALAANCFLKYLWWTACSSAWQGIPKLAAQWKAAGARASFNGWSVVILELASTVILFRVLGSGSSGASGFFRNAPRLIFASIITIAGTAVLALVLTWVKQGLP